MIEATAVIGRCLTLVGGTAVALAVGAGGARLFNAAGVALDDSMEDLFDDRADRPHHSAPGVDPGR